MPEESCNYGFSCPSPEHPGWPITVHTNFSLTATRLGPARCRRRFGNRAWKWVRWGPRDRGPQEGGGAHGQREAPDGQEQAPVGQEAPAGQLQAPVGQQDGPRRAAGRLLPAGPGPTRPSPPLPALSPGSAQRQAAGRGRKIPNFVTLRQPAGSEGGVTHGARDK